MEIANHQKDLKEKPKENPDQTAQFMMAWRSSDFYDFVMEVLKKELETSYVKDVISQRILNGDKVTNDEIGDELRIEIQTNLRIQNIIETLK